VEGCDTVLPAGRPGTPTPRLVMMAQGHGRGRRRLAQLASHVLEGATAASPPATPFHQYSELLAELDRRRAKHGGGRRPMTVLGHAPDGSPLVVIKCGGEKLPAVFISAGAHSSEQAGVVAAVQLVSEISTEHTVYILPCRDPIGLNGFRAALGLGLGRESREQLPTTVAEAVEFLRERGEVLYDEEGRLIALLGDHAYTIREGHSGSMITAGDPALTTGPVHQALLGRRIFWPSNYKSDSSSTGHEGVVEGAGEMQRAYTQFGTPDDILHINRFHDTPWCAGCCAPKSAGISLCIPLFLSRQ
jgi:hypothetical protein